MSLVKCPECRKEVSDKAVACPHCGYPMAGQYTVNKREIDGKLETSVSAPSQELGKLMEDHEFSTYLREGNKIHAIKRCRELTGWDLRVAKDSVEALARANNIRFQKSGGCFIATACYGTPYAREVLVLQEYRDTVMLNSRIGTWAALLYNRVSPPIARITAQSPLLKKIFTKFLVAPLARLVTPKIKIRD